MLALRGQALAGGGLPAAASEGPGAAQEWQWQPLFFSSICRALRPLPDCSGASSKWQLEVPVVWPAALRLLQLGDAMNGSTKVGAWPRG